MLGLIARSDGGGLAAQTLEAWRHLRPAKTLVVHVQRRTRGRTHPERFQGVGELRLTPTVPDREDLRWLLDGIDTFYSAETWYSPAVVPAARTRGVRLVLHVNPEFYDGSEADVMLAPTPWRQPENARLLPVPVARDRFAIRKVEKVTTLYHVASFPGGGDRNGTALVLAAVGLMREPARLLVRGLHTRRTTRNGGVEVSWLGHSDDPYYEAWPEEADALVLPRRYGGLSLPMQEAAALGLPVIALDRDPERSVLAPEALVEASGSHVVRYWEQRTIEALDAGPAVLAAKLDELVSTPALASMLAETNLRWADEIDWVRLLPEYEALL